MNHADFADVWIGDDLTPMEACVQLVAAAEELRAGVKATYRGRWIAAESDDDPHHLYQALVNTPPDWPGIVAAGMRITA